MPATLAPTESAGLVVALPAEARCLGLRGARIGACLCWRRGWVAISGIGPHNAMHAAERLLSCGATLLVSWGVAGALDEKFAPGDMLIPEHVLHASDDIGFATDPQISGHMTETLSTQLQVRRGDLWSSEQPITTRADKRALAARTGAVAVDMEAAAVAAVAARAQLPFVAVKAICDPASRELPARIAQTLGAGVSLRLLAAIAFGGPATWHATRKLAQDFGCARRSLAIASRLLDA